MLLKVIKKINDKKYKYFFNCFSYCILLYLYLYSILVILVFKADVKLPK